MGGVAWSNGQRRRLPLQGSRVRISVLPFFYLEKRRAVRLRKVSRQEERENEAAAQERREERKNRQADQEWLRERRSVRFEDD